MNLANGFTLPGGNNLASSIVSTQTNEKEWWRTPSSLPYILEGQAAILNKIPFANNEYVQKLLSQYGLFSFLGGLESFFDPFYIKYSVNGYFFDGVIRADHTSRTKITSHPVQTGANITDHAFVEPGELMMEIAMSDVMADKVNGQFGTGDGRSKKAFDVLLEMQKSRVPMQIVTRLKTYDNMLIESIEAPDDFKTTSGLRANVTFKEIIVASVSEIKVSARPQTTDSTNRGDLKAENINSNKTLGRVIEETILNTK